MVNSSRLASHATIGLFIIAAFAVLDMAQNVFAPILTAVVIGVFLGPPSDKAEALGVPRLIVALLVVIFFIAFAVAIGLLLSGPVSQLIEEAPRIIRRVTVFFDGLRSSLDTLQGIQQRISEAIPGSENALVVEDEEPHLTDAISLAPAFLGQSVIFLGSLFFFTLSRPDIYAAISRLASEPSEEMRLATVLRSTERTMSQYFLAITLINVMLGVCVFIMTYLYGLASPALWGLLAFGLNYILFLGPVCMVLMLAIAGIAAFDGVYAIAPAATFIVFNMIEGQFATPSFVGKTLTMNPLLVFVSLVFGLWLWGPIGGFLAIPILLIILAFIKLDRIGTVDERDLSAQAAQEVR